MPVPVMGIRKVGMGMLQRFMAVAIPPVGGLGKIIGVSMMAVVHMAVVMFQRVVDVPVFMPFGQM